MKLKSGAKIELETFLFEALKKQLGFDLKGKFVRLNIFLLQSAPIFPSSIQNLYFTDMILSLYRENDDLIFKQINSRASHVYIPLSKGTQRSVKDYINKSFIEKSKIVDVPNPDGTRTPAYTSTNIQSTSRYLMFEIDRLWSPSPNGPKMLQIIWTANQSNYKTN